MRSDFSLNRDFEHCPLKYSLVTLDKLLVGELLDVDDFWEIMLENYSCVGGGRRHRTSIGMRRGITALSSFAVLCTAFVDRDGRDEQTYPSTLGAIL